MISYPPLEEEQEQQARITVFDNGVTIVTLEYPHAHSAVFGLWIHNGSRHDGIGQSGYAHCYEHSLYAALANDAQFVGIKNNSGASINAQTGRELTTVFGQAPAESVQPILEKICRCLSAPLFDSKTLQQEINRIQQEKYWQGHDMFEQTILENIWPQHSIAQPILADLTNINTEKLLSYHRQRFVGSRISIVAVGKLVHRQIVEACNCLQTLESGNLQQTSPPIHHSQNQNYFHSEGQQAQLAWLYPIPGMADRIRFSLQLAKSLLTDGDDGKLFNALSTEGLSYALGSELVQFSDCGYWLISTQCLSENKERCQQLFQRVLINVIDDGFSKNELLAAKQSLRAKLIAQQDDLQDTMEKLAKEMIYTGQHYTIDCCLNHIESISSEDIQLMLKDIVKRQSHFCWQVKPANIKNI